MTPEHDGHDDPLTAWERELLAGRRPAYDRADAARDNMYRAIERLADTKRHTLWTIGWVFAGVVLAIVTGRGGR